MRELHVVALSEDGRHVTLATDQGAVRGDYRVAIDDRLAAAVRGDLPRPGEEQLPNVTPKDIQARLRAGESVEQIAMSAGMPVSRVERFAGPVLSEIERMVTGARVAIVHRTRRGPSALPLGEAVDQRLAESASYRAESTRWTARREKTGRWLVEVSWLSRARERTAAWRYDPATREVAPVDTASAALAHVDASTGQPAVQKPPVQKSAVQKPPVQKSAVQKSAVRAVRTKAPASPRVVAAPAAPPARKAASSGRRPDKAPVGGVVAPAPTKPSTAAPAAPAATKKVAAAPAARVRVRKAPARAVPAPAAQVPVEPVVPVVPVVPSGPPTLRVVPSPHPAPDEPALDEPAPRDRDDDRDDDRNRQDAPAAEPEPDPVQRVRRVAGQRASVPSWSDVLLGTESPRGGRSSD